MRPVKNTQPNKSIHTTDVLHYEISPLAEMIRRSAPFYGVPCRLSGDVPLQPQYINVRGRSYGNTSNDSSL